MKYRIWDELNIRYDRWIVCNQEGNLFDALRNFELGNEDDNYIIEQSTGVFDKNGKEIYCNHQVTWNTATMKRIGIVRFANGEFRIFVEGVGDYRLVWAKDMFNIEIIGNIHEVSEDE